MKDPEKQIDTMNLTLVSALDTNSASENKHLMV